MKKLFELKKVEGVMFNGKMESVDDAVVFEATKNGKKATIIIHLENGKGGVYLYGNNDEQFGLDVANHMISSGFADEVLNNL